MPFRNLARTPRRTLMSLLGIAAVITILVALAGVFDSFNRALAASHDEALARQPAADDGDACHDRARPPDRSCERSSTRPPWPPPSPRSSSRSRCARSARVDRRQPAAPRPGRARSGGRGSPTATSPRGAGGIVLAAQAAEDLGLHVGDTVTLAHPVRTGPTRFRTATSAVEIVALHANPLRGLAYMASGQAGLFGLAGAANTVELRPRGSPEALTRALFAIPGVASVESGSAVPDAVRSYMDEFLAILRITQTVTLLLAVLIAFNTMSIATEERRREHATMLAFGTPPRSILRNAVVESALIGTLGTIVGLALGLAILGWIVNVVSRDTYPELGLPRHPLARIDRDRGGGRHRRRRALPAARRRRLRNMDIPSTLRVVE